MARTTAFCVQPYARDPKGKLIQVQGRPCKDAEAAVRVGRELAPRFVGVVVYSITGDTEFDNWSEPVVLASHGVVPELVQ